MQATDSLPFITLQILVVDADHNAGSSDPVPDKWAGSL